MEESVPVCHVYYPDTFVSVLKSFFLKCDKPGVILGRWEVRPGKPGRHEESKGEGVRLRRRTRGGATSSSSRSTTEIKKEELSQEDPCNRQVLAVNIVGIVETGEYDCDGDLQIIGEVNSNPASGYVHDLEEPGLHFDFNRATGELKIAGVSWKGQLHLISGSSKVVVFVYDPFEFQQWKIPRGYPLGVPPVFLEGLGFIQDQLQSNSKLDFTPAFPPVLQDHHDLNACAEPPQSSYFYTNPGLKFVSSRSSGLQQVLHKTSLLIGAALGSYQILPVLNLLFLIVLDSMVGYIISSYLMEIPNMLGLMHTTVQDMLDRLNHLLRWLRGAPAGLKLNVNLNSLYWRFFSYHIHLWANYIGLLEPIFVVILHTIQYFGVLGSTIQVSLLKDLLSLATFHVYCLYIYASRLYSLQTSAIKALCRIFFGKKYNPLRDRIDSVQLNIPELFLSSFGFVILIFLLPTTMVYYVGFVCLRVPVLLIGRVLEYFVSALNKLPIVSWILVYLKSPRVADEIYLTPIISSSSSIISIKNNFITFRLSLRSTRTLFSAPDFSRGIKDIVGAVIGGTVLKD